MKRKGLVKKIVSLVMAAALTATMVPADYLSMTANAAEISVTDETSESEA